MKVFKSRFKNIEYFIFRIFNPIINPVKSVKGCFGYFWFARDMAKYKLSDKKSKLLSLNLFPILDEKTSLTSFDAHYFYQQLWVFENVLKNRPNRHIDVGSTYQMSGYLSKIVQTVFVDLRPIEARIKNLEIKKGNILNLPFEDNSVQSLSCLHVAEHIGLGRYGDKIDPRGAEKACRELSRILAAGGLLYFSLPVGKNRVCFNAHRVFSPAVVIEYFKELKLVSFNAVDDEGNYKENVSPYNYQNISYGCGMFLFRK